MATYTWQKMDEWAEKMHRRFDHVAAHTTARVIEQQQMWVGHGGNMPIDTGELRDSLAIDINGKILIGAESYLDLLTEMKAGDVVRWGWTVQYAMRINYGFVGYDSLGRYYNQKGRHFIEYGEMQYDRIYQQEVKFAETIK